MGMTRAGGTTGPARSAPPSSSGMGMLPSRRTGTLPVGITVTSEREREGKGEGLTLPPWQVARVVVLWHCLRCGFEWLPGRWWRPGVTRLPLPQACPGCGSYLWRSAPDEVMRPTMKDVAAAEALARRRG